jgi:hypothetical protein
MVQYDILLSFRGNFSKEEMDTIIEDVKMVSALNVASRAIMEDQNNMRFSKEYMSRTRVNILPESQFPTAVYLDVIPPKIRNIDDMDKFMSVVMFFLCETVKKVCGHGTDDDGAVRRFMSDMDEIVSEDESVLFEIRGNIFLYRKN